MAKKRKGAEGRIPNLAKRYGFGWRKYRDVTLCIHCFKPQPKSERMPDFSIAPAILYVEVKESGKDGRFSFKNSVTDIQREFFKDYPGFIFLEMGSGRAPKHKSAYMIPTEIWFSVTDDLIELGYASFGREKSRPLKKDEKGCPGTDFLFLEWECDWVPMQRDCSLANDDLPGGWDIPIDHPFWKQTEAKLLKAMNSIPKKTT